MLIKSFLIIVSLSIASLIYLTPIYKSLDCPSAQYKIGTTLRFVKDNERIDTHTLNKGPRELMLQIWYPTDAIHGKKALYLENVLPILKTDLQAKTYLPNFVVNRLLDVTTCSLLDSSVSNESETYPVVIFMSSGLHARYIENIVSNGYIVVGITFDNYLMPDGKTKRSTLSDDFMSNTELAYKELEVRATDIQFTLTQLNELNKHDHLLRNKLKLNKVAFMGHSFNGIAALGACRKDNRCTAVINLDGSLSFDPKANQPIEKPTLMLLQDYERESFLAKRLKGSTTTKAEYLKYKYSSFESLCKSPQDPVYIILIRKAGHDSFSDTIFLKYPLAALLGHDIAEDDSYKIFNTISKYVISFLDKYLKDKLAPLLADIDTCKVYYNNQNC